MDVKQQVMQAIDVLLAEDAVRDFHDGLAAARGLLAERDSPLQVPALCDGPVARLVAMQCGGYLDPAAHAAAEARAGRLPSVPELIALARAGEPAAAGDDQAQQATASPARSGAGLRANRDRSATTFLFMSDPQPSTAEAAANGERYPRVARLNRLNQAISGLDGSRWPNNPALSCAGHIIGPLDGVFFGGDMCQTGGSYNLADQFYYEPTTYRGGWELQHIRSLYQPGFVPFLVSGDVLCPVQPCYYGLGNHDIQGNYNPDQSGTSTGVPGFLWHPGWETTTADDYWRDQMWNFVCQMHTGVHWIYVTTDPVAPVTAIDADGSGDYHWRKHSFNYKVDLGPVDVYQMHRYGGDSEWGRPDGLDWLRDQLARGGAHRPVIVVQHLPFFDYDVLTPTWTKQQRDDFLNLLAPYNVIALLTGHIHDSPALNQAPVVPSTGGTLREFRPGSAGDLGTFAVVRVTATSLDVAFGNGDSGSLQWSDNKGAPLQAQSFSLNPFPGWDLLTGSTTFTAAPAAHVPDDSTRFVYAVGQDRQLYHTGWNQVNNSWSAQWAPLGGSMAGKPTVVSAAPGTHDVFVVGTDSALWHVAFTGTSWKGPIPLGGQLYPGVSAAASGQGRIDIVGRGLDGRLWYLTGSSAGFGPWQQRDGTLFSTPSLVAWSSDELQMVALGADSNLLHQWYIKSTGTWSGWETRGEQLTSPPVIVAPSPKTLSVFFRGSDFSLRHRFWDGGWGGGSSSLGGLLGGTPNAVTDPATGRIEVWVAQLDHIVGRIYRDGGFGTLTGQGGLSSEQPELTMHHSGNAIAVDAFVLGVDGNIYHKLVS